jgi:hypothetical protein
MAWFFARARVEVWQTARRVALPMLLGPCVGLIFLGYYNHRLTGDALVPPHLLDQRLYEPLLPFAWQPQPPPHAYANPQFEKFYNGWVLHAYHQPWSLLSWHKLVDWWGFFLGWILIIPVLALPCMLRDRRIRLPLLILLWCWAGLLAVVYFEPHYAAPMSAALVILLVQAMRHVRRWKLRGRPIGIFFSRLVILLLLARVAALTVAASRFSWDNWSQARVRVLRQLENTPGRHLVIVQYSPDHNVHREWVYNAADIDDAKVVWAREIPGQPLAPLLKYFSDRKVWTVKPDAETPVPEPYRGEEQAR